MSFSNILQSIVSYSKREHVRAFQWCVYVVVVWRVVLEIVNHTFAKFDSIHHVHVTGIHFGLDRWLSWDGQWYYSIINQGYFLDYSRAVPTNIPFFPGFPVITELLSKITTIHPIYIGLVLNVILTVFCAYYLYHGTLLLAIKLRAKQHTVKYAPYIAVVLFLIFPSSLFLAAFYAEALLIFGISGAVYYALKNKLLVAAVFAGIACSTKSIGVAVLPAILLIDYQQQATSLIDIVLIRKKIWLYIAASIIGLSGILLYMSYLWFAFGDPLLFSSLQKVWLREVRSDFLIRLWEIYYRNTFKPAYFEGTFNYIITNIAMYGPIVALVASFLFAKKYRFYWLLPLAIITIFLPASTAIMQSMNRYIFCLTPLFSMFAILLARKRIIWLGGILGVCISLLIYATAGFLLGDHFAG